jgi:hypothetical protein
MPRRWSSLRAAEGVLRDVLGEREIGHPEDSREGGDETAGLTTEEMLGELHAQG